ncbi:stalk domain-containing protein [Cohnella boryungensis]|uniref:Stalk domain-containing protein n=1 Tax=Cohnella boryungensis TaxID=768479 RepID=A0ABV8SHH4_9BACL
MDFFTYKVSRVYVLILVICCLLLPNVVGAEEAGSNAPAKTDDLRFLMATQIEAGDEAAYAIGTDGTIWGWGGGYGSLGHGATTTAFLPARIHIENVRQISSGYRHTLFLKEDGTVWAVGGNEHGQLGIGKKSDSEELFTEPVQVLGLTDILQVAAGDNHSLAVKRDGTVWAWGGNEHGQLGDDSKENGLQPRAVEGLPKVNSVAAGQYTSLALGNGGEIWVWGMQAYNPNKFHIRKPTQLPSDREFIAVAADSFLGAALDSTGSVWVWDNINSNGKKAALLPVRVPSLNNVVSFTTRSAVDAKGSAWSWQYDNGVIRQFKALKLPTNQAKVISEGSRNIYVLMRDGSIYSTGFNQFGQTGQGTLDIEIKDFRPVRKAAAIILNGKKMEPAVPPLNLNEVTYVPLRGVLEAMGVNIRWDIPSRSVIADKDNKRIVFNTVSGQTTVDGNVVQLDAKPVSTHGSLLVPLRFVSETLGAKVVWNAADYSVEITS